MIELECTFRGLPHKIHAVRKEALFGPGIDVKLLSSNGTLVNKIGFLCHPEFEDYERFRSMSTQELLAHIVERLQSGKLDAALEACRASGIQLLLRFNSPDASAPNRTDHL